MPLLEMHLFVLLEDGLQGTYLIHTLIYIKGFIKEDYSKISFLYITITLLLSISYFSLGLIGLIVFNVITIYLYYYLDRKFAEPFPIRT